MEHLAPAKARPRRGGFRCIAFAHQERLRCLLDSTINSFGSLAPGDPGDGRTVRRAVWQDIVAIQYNRSSDPML
jgi:hypothetical protein